MEIPVASLVTILILFLLKTGPSKSKEKKKLMEEFHETRPWLKLSLETLNSKKKTLMDDSQPNSEENELPPETRPWLSETFLKSHPEFQYKRPSIPPSPWSSLAKLKKKKKSGRRPKNSKKDAICDAHNADEQQSEAYEECAYSPTYQYMLEIAREPIVEDFEKGRKFE